MRNRLKQVNNDVLPAPLVPVSKYAPFDGTSKTNELIFFKFVIVRVVFIVCDQSKSLLLAKLTDAPAR